MANDLAPPIAAPQQSRGPRPLPLFLSLVTEVAKSDPALASAALHGLRRYQQAPSPPPRSQRPTVERLRGASLRDCGGSGSTLVLVPSLINSPDILDLDAEGSFAGALAARHRVLLLDWGPAMERREFDLLGHVEQILLPLIERQGRIVLVGYCLGGTLALAAAARSSNVRATVTLAAPWNFGAYGPEERAALQKIWRASEPVAERLGTLPMEVLQAAFWQVDPHRVVAKFARFAALPEDDPQARRFVILEDWANGGEPLPTAAARTLVEELFVGGGTLAPLPACPLLHFTATDDRIVPTSTAPPGEQIACASGHVGMIAGRKAAMVLHRPLLSWLEGLDRAR